MKGSGGALKSGSLFDGSGGFPLAGAINGIEPVWASEIEPYPLRVTGTRFPNMKQLGDVTKIDGTAIEPVDVITFGSPCQDLSIAGNQAGIHEGERSSLFFEAVRIIKEMREHDRRTGRAVEHLRPRYAVWENVPGAFSSNKGADFQAVLKALCEVTDTGVSVPLPEKGKWQKAGCIVGDGYSIAWRVYDAQFWGVPQRRKRIYLIADFGSERAGEILFERESMFRDSAKGREEGQGTAENAERSVGRKSEDRLTALQLSGVDFRHGNLTEEKVLTLQAKSTGGHSLNYMPGVVYDCRGNGNGKTVPTLTGDHQNRVTDYTALCVGNGQLHQISMSEKSNTLDCMHDQQAILTSGNTTRKYIVRRLTPLECCRLQGFPDWWEDGVEGSDSARYKMWGNGIALPCAVDVLGRIAKANRNEL